MGQMAKLLLLGLHVTVVEEAEAVPTSCYISSVVLVWAVGYIVKYAVVK